MFQVLISKLGKTETLEHRTPSNNRQKQSSIHRNKTQKTKQSLPKNLAETKTPLKYN